MSTATDQAPEQSGNLNGSVTLNKGVSDLTCVTLKDTDGLEKSSGNHNAANNLINGNGTVHASAQDVVGTDGSGKNTSGMGATQDTRKSQQDPVVGMSFSSEEQAFDFYNAYARGKGFSVRKGHLSRRKDRSIRDRHLLCSFEGKRQPHRSHVTRKPRPLERTNCLARVELKVNSDKRWVIHRFIDEHNHPLASPNKTFMLRSHRKKFIAERAVFTESDFYYGVKPAPVQHLRPEVSAVAGDVPVFAKDQISCLSTQRLRDFEKGDAQLLLDFLKVKQSEDPSFIYAVQLDEKERLTNCFWTDARSVLDYSYFGDAVTLETTYRSSRFDLPFVAFIGVNHHKQVVVFGAALLLDESVESFIWLLKTFLSAMSGQQPKTILTDLCPAISKAIVMTMPDTCHQLCLWHIVHNASKLVQGVVSHEQAFRKDFENMIYGCTSEDDFRREWDSLVSKHGLVVIPWFANLLSSQEKWSLVYYGNTFCGLATTKKWSEIMDSLFKFRFYRKLPLSKFMAQRCVEVEARVLRVATRGGGGEEVEARVVVLVDVYLPLAAWSGWQFPRSRTAAAALFNHVSCDWDARNSLLAFDWSSHGNSHCDDQYIWSCTDCHVLYCKVHQISSLSSNEKSYDLHEIFKTLPSVRVDKRTQITRIKPDEAELGLGISAIPDDVLNKVLAQLKPRDLIRVATTCHHLRTLAASIMPYMKLKLFPHQEAAVEWMLKREQNSQVLAHPLYKDFCTADGFPFYINVTSGEISTADAPTINDFHGGMFCDEPGLGKTVTTLSLILKTHGTLTDPPEGVDVKWCMHRPDKKYGYYEISASNSSNGNFLSGSKRLVGKDVVRENLCSSELSHSDNYDLNTRSSRKLGRLVNPDTSLVIMDASCEKSPVSSPTNMHSLPATHVLQLTRNLSDVRKNLMDAYGKGSSGNKRKRENTIGATSELNETWVQCDACRKWRRLSDGSVLDSTAAWFCNMNTDSARQKCTASEESWDSKRKITYLPGFYKKGTSPGNGKNVSFFINILKEYVALFNSETEKALMWLAKLSPRKHLEMETIGLTRPVLDARATIGKGARPYCKIFQAFGLVRKVEQGVSRWYYPSMLDDLAFDSSALGIALKEPLDLVRFYLSKATLIVVPANLIDHWTTQIQRHVSSGTLSVYIWGDNKKPSAHNLAWDYDIVITTFSRLSAEWGPRKRSVLKQIHWLRVILDEGHTLGSSLALTNKLQMAVSLVASNRWILTGTPTPNTPTSQVAHLHPMLKFLHEEVYGQNHQSWDSAIHRPFEAQMEEGRIRLILLLQRTMISARKADLKSIPPCIKKITFLDFNEGHANSYNELVATIRRNILMADWNDPSHVESLLNPKQWKFRTTTIRNVRLSCCVAGHIKVAEAGQDIQETMDALVQLGLDSSEEHEFIRFSLLNGTSCFRCNSWCRLPVITPCRHLLCLDCVALDSEKCTFPGCGNHYEMQSPETLARPENPNPKWPVPKDLIELQPSYKQDDWDPDWQSTSSSKVAYLVEKLKSLQEADRKNGYSIDIANGIGFGSESSCQDINNNRECRPFQAMPDKVIIFSQFLEHIHVIEQQLTIAGITYVGMYSPMPLSKKRNSLITFQDDPTCMALLMDGTAALGLDLSFVTHVFLMEPIWDRSMEEQVISRAHRMGATRPIHVETLAMRGTIEEQMLKLLQDSNACRRMVNRGTSSSDNEGARPHRSLHDFAESSYLEQLSFVQTRSKAASNEAKIDLLLT